MTLPVVPIPEPGESLRSYVSRLEDRNNQRPGTLARVHGGGVSADWAHLSELTGLPQPQLRCLGWGDYPGCIVGARGSTGWRLRQAQWWCPTCQLLTGAWQRSWELACLPVCLSCGTALSTYPATEHEPEPVTAQWVFKDIWARVRQSTTSRRARQWLGRLLRVTRLLAVTADTSWPQPMPAAMVTDLNTWGYHPPDSPAAIARLLPFAHRLIGTSEERPILQSAFARLERREPPIPRSLLPKPPRANPTTTYPVLATVPSAIDEQRRRRLQDDLEGFDVNLVPAIASDDRGQFLPDPDQWSTAQEAALAIHMLANPRRDGQAGWATEALQHFHLPYGSAAQRLKQLEAGSITAEFESCIRAAAAFAVTEGIDYHHRRHVLIQLSKPPRGPKGQVPNHLVRGWMWVYLTHGLIVPSGPRWIYIDNPLPTQTVVDMHNNMSLEARFQLAEHAETLWTMLSSDDIRGEPQTQPAWRQHGQSL